uniref:C-JID domain-containing protein n=1 Tax=Lotus japonicus TaxID=34305 RepID=I3SF05_LOTJA|nr:unknown [Lotus japonicus]
MAIGLNAQINVMKFAQQHLSALKLDFVENYDDYSRNYDSYQAVHAFPGSRVPEWLEYKTMGDSVIIDLSCPPTSPLFGFIFCFVNDKWPKYDEWLKYDEFPNYYKKFKLKFTISAGEDDAGEDKKDSIEVNMYLNSMYTRGDHVCVMYDQRCSRYLSRRSQNLSRFQIKVTPWWLPDFLNEESEERMELKGFGVSLISTFKYDSFVRQMKLRDSGGRNRIF